MTRFSSWKRWDSSLNKIVTMAKTSLNHLKEGNNTSSRFYKLVESSRRRMSAHTDLARKDANGTDFSDVTHFVCSHVGACSGKQSSHWRMR
ncbi:hypothetical protein PsorP6_016001 [Peronosclerospora sorghi]|uniref:Uncharacterized protein n=1 Tax=Peronosclerospora sorghi TaxID=230839 RepID=A0ACC0WPQ4_9STRA|nr:hypothetical protein PsorP6_016001 [Peronosclerospora sorghi]